MGDLWPAPRLVRLPVGGSGPTRRQVLVALLLAPVAATGAAACADGGGSDGPDPLIALAGQARADAALAAAVIAANSALAGRLEPLRAARTEHAAALDAEVARLDPGRGTPAPVPPAEGAARPVALAALREAVTASGRNAAEAALGLPAARVGVVASVAACCSTYAAVLG